MSNQNSKCSFWDVIASLSTFFLAICTIIIVIYGWKNVGIITKDIELKIRPYVDLQPEVPATLMFYYAEDEVIITVDFELFNGSEVPTKGVQLRVHQIRIGPELWFLGKRTSEEEISNFFKKTKDSEKVYVKYSEARFHISPQGRPMYFPISIYLTKEQFDVLHKASQSDEVEKSIYIYYSVLYEGFFGKNYTTSYFYEIVPIPCCDDWHKKKDSEEIFFNLDFGVIWSESKEDANKQGRPRYKKLKSIG